MLVRHSLLRGMFLMAVASLALFFLCPRTYADNNGDSQSLELQVAQLQQEVAAITGQIAAVQKQLRDQKQGPRGPQADPELAIATLSGVVTDLNGNPLAGVDVTITDANNIAAGYVTTGSNGSYNLVNLLPGNYAIDFYSASFGASPTDNLALTAGGNTYNAAMSGQPTATVTTTMLWKGMRDPNPSITTTTSDQQTYGPFSGAKVTITHAYLGDTLTRKECTHSLCSLRDFLHRLLTESEISRTVTLWTPKVNRQNLAT
jgi:hypothetical protein